MARDSLLDFFADFAAIAQTFLVFDDGFRTRRYSYRQVAGAAANFALLLQKRGLAPGEKVIIWSENRPEWIAAFWGILLAGGVVVPVDYRSSDDLLGRIQGIVAARFILAGDEVKARPSDWRLADFDWQSASIPNTQAASGNLCEIIFTSGATADPKGVTITHGNLLANIVPVETEIRKHRKWSIPFRPIRFLNLLPLSHLFGQSMATFIPAVLPGEVVFMAGYNPREIVRQIHDRRISVLVSVPKLLDVLREFVLHAVPNAADPPPPKANWMRRWWHYRRVHDLFGWKFWCFVVGAAPLDPALEEWWSQRGFLVVQGYGLTETAPIVTLNHPFHTSKGSVGTPIGGVEIRIANDGEILVRGPNVTSGYFGAQDESTAFEDGWFHTGDIGERDAEGRVFVRGRKKEMIVTPEGLNVFPEDVERVLNALPGVRESAVVGVTDEGRERVHAVLSLAAGENAERVLGSANALLESHQQIRSASVWEQGPLPRTEGTEKLKRVAIRDWVLGNAKPAASSQTAATVLEGFTDDTPLAQLGLSSLDRVQLMMQSERNGTGGVSEGAFQAVTTVGELRALSRETQITADERIPFPQWGRSLVARAIRRVMLPLVCLPLLRIFVWLRPSINDSPMTRDDPMSRDCRGAVSPKIQTLPADAHPLLFAANHQSIFDVPAILLALPARYRYRTATAAGMEWFRPHFHPQGYGWWERFGNHLQYYLSCLVFNTFPLPQHEAGARDALRYMGDLVSDGWSILLFPEGVRTTEGEIAPFRPGVGMIGSRLELPVCPVRIEGLERVLPADRKWPRPGRVAIRFGREQALKGDDFAALSADVERAVRDL